jgi:uroporphyrin-III C-methyltransferase
MRNSHFVFRQAVGTVYLIGAGPGDPGLMTVKGLDLLRSADVVLYDALVNPALLHEASPSAELIDVGKRAGRHKLSQSRINRLLIDRAYSCRCVVRLKGGDPFVFGRGGEELAALKLAGVPVEVVPGVTSAVAALAYAGVPVTHRGVAANFAVVTGHRAEGEDDTGYWSALAHLDTLVILMGMKNLPQISRTLIDAGRDADTPALAVRWGTLPQQEVVSGTLGNLAERIVLAGLKSPAVIVVGAVAALSDTLNWLPSVVHQPELQLQQPAFC